MKPNATCKDCKDRTVGCHGTCEKYKAFEEENKKYKEAVRKEKAVHGKLIYQKGGKTWIR